MWNDINYPKAGKLPEIFAHYYNTVKDGVINIVSVWNFPISRRPNTQIRQDHGEEVGIRSPVPAAWDSASATTRWRGPEQVIASEKLIWLLVDIVSKNGNLLLNIGPRPDGSSPIFSSIA